MASQTSLRSSSSYRHIGVHEIARNHERKRIDSANKILAMKLINVKGHMQPQEEVQKEFLRQMRAKELLCKLPIIDMKNNTFRYGGAEMRGGATMFEPKGSIMSRKSSVRSGRSRSRKNSAKKIAKHSYVNQSMKP